MNKFGKMLSLALLVLATGSGVFAQQPGEVPPDFLQNATPLHSSVRPLKDSNIDLSSQNSSGVPGIDSVVNFVKSFNANGVDFFGNPNDVWSYAMVGGAPENGGRTFINAPVIPVSLDLLAADGSVAQHYDV